MADKCRNLFGSAAERTKNGKHHGKTWLNDTPNSGRLRKWLWQLYGSAAQRTKTRKTAWENVAQ